jgi:hypothetical protein
VVARSENGQACHGDSVDLRLSQIRDNSPVSIYGEASGFHPIQIRAARPQAILGFRDRNSDCLTILSFQDAAPEWRPTDGPLYSVKRIMAFDFVPIRHMTTVPVSKVRAAETSL